jgi:ElaB/YqjD/DUF883 family membrane-anchored ribosome-binding protein
MDRTSTSDKITDAFQSASDANKVAREKLIKGMKGVIGDAEHWLKHAGSEGGEDLLAVKEKLAATLQTTKNDLLKLEMNMLDRTRLAAQESCAYVKENPWKSAGVGAAVGALVGWLVLRK